MYATLYLEERVMFDESYLGNAERQQLERERKMVNSLVCDTGHSKTSKYSFLQKLKH